MHFAEWHERQIAETTNADSEDILGIEDCVERAFAGEDRSFNEWQAEAQRVARLMGVAAAYPLDPPDQQRS